MRRNIEEQKVPEPIEENERDFADEFQKLTELHEGLKEAAKYDIDPDILMDSRIIVPGGPNVPAYKDDVFGIQKGESDYLHEWGSWSSGGDSSYGIDLQDPLFSWR